MLQLRGSAAHPRFRLHKLESLLRTSLPGLKAAYAEFWHFVDTPADLPPEKEEALRRLLDCGQSGASDNARGELFVVVPRLGTISPWSTKATDIAHHCGLPDINRIERGIAWWLQHSAGEIRTDAERARIIEHIHDPMTESVLRDFSECAELFRHFEPRPLEVVDVLNGGVSALARAGQEWGMALSDD